APPVERPWRLCGGPGGGREAGAARSRAAGRPRIRCHGHTGGGAVSELRVGPAGSLTGELSVPGDKSVSHRAVMLGALADESVTVTGFGASADTLATVDAFRAMGVRIEQPQPDMLVIHGVGMRG